MNNVSDSLCNSLAPAMPSESARRIMPVQDGKTPIPSSNSSAKRTREPEQDSDSLLSEFNAWLLKEESDNGSMGLSQLERDQMCLSYCAGHRDTLTLQPSATLLRALNISRFSFSTRTGVYLDEEGDYAPFTQVEVLRAEALKQRKSYERAMHACDKQGHALTQQATRIHELEQQLYNLQRIPPPPPINVPTAKTE